MSQKWVWVYWFLDIQNFIVCTSFCILFCHIIYITFITANCIDMGFSVLYIVFRDISNSFWDSFCFIRSHIGACTSKGCSKSLNKILNRPWNKDFRTRCNSDLILQEAALSMFLYSFVTHPGATSSFTGANLRFFTRYFQAWSKSPTKWQNRISNQNLHIQIRVLMIPFFLSALCHYFSSLLHPWQTPT